MRHRWLCGILGLVFSISHLSAQQTPEQRLESWLSTLRQQALHTGINSTGKGKAPVNLALSKYWGKRVAELNIPDMPSVSISLPFYTTTRVSLSTQADTILLDGKIVDLGSSFARQIISFLDLFRPRGLFFFVETRNEIPAQVGVASSASGGAALVRALNELFGWGCTAQQLSILARMFSGSASRSIHIGFVEWNAGYDDDGMDSYAEPLSVQWPQLRVGLMIVSDVPKQISSRDGMIHTKETSPLYGAWVAEAWNNVLQLRKALLSKNLNQAGPLIESNAFTMHAAMMASSPALFYWNAKTVEVFEKVWELRRSGIPIYISIDAGPNPFLIFEKKDKKKVQEAFPGIKIVAPIFEERKERYVLS